MKKTILVTGGAGYVGNVLVRELLKNSYKVRILDKLIFTEKPLEEIKDRVEIVQKDILKVEPSIMENIDAVIHLAGLSTEPTSQCNPRLTDLINHIGTERIAQLAKEKGIERFIFASSCSVYFTYNSPLDPIPNKEADLVNPISPYSLSKRAAEQVLLELTDGKFKPIIFRKGTIYGLSPRMRYDLVLNSFIKDAFLKHRIIVNAGGQIWRPMIDIQDVVQAYIKAIELPLEKIGGKIFNISNENWNIGEFAKKFQKIIKERKNIDIEIDVQPVGITRNYKSDNLLFKETFLYNPSRNLESAISEIWDCLEKNPKEAIDPVNYNDKWEIDLIYKGKL